MWSLLGTFDWNSLVTRDDDVYEVGARRQKCTSPPHRARDTREWARGRDADRSDRAAARMVAAWAPRGPDGSLW